MTYFQFLLLFLVIPIFLLLVLHSFEKKRSQPEAGISNEKTFWVTVVALIVLAVLYTTPWDNYLVATGVWFYNPSQVSGVVIGYVPLEEYTFFVLETFFVGLWWWFLARRLAPAQPFKPTAPLRFILPSLLGTIWLGAAFVLLSGWKPGVYISLILVWALPAIALQLAYGADLLWHFRKLVVTAVVPIWLYISAADSLAIASGIWTIPPTQSTGIRIGTLPIEEAAFFLVTVLLVGFGLTLTHARASTAPSKSPLSLFKDANPAAQQDVEISS